TSNPSVLIAAGLLARAAVEKGLGSKPWVKTSLMPGSTVVSKYLEATGLQSYLDELGFAVVGYGCGTCFGASGPIDAELEKKIIDNDIVACAVLSGNRNFEGRIHPAVRAAFLASPPLVVAFALTGRVDVDLESEPIGHSDACQPVYLRDIWPTGEQLDRALTVAVNPSFYREIYSDEIVRKNRFWASIAQVTGELYPWDSDSTYIKEPPFLDAALRESTLLAIQGARPLAILGNSITTDHISPIGNINSTSPAGTYLQSCGVGAGDFNNYGARRMNHEVMMRGMFANARLRNLMVPGVDGGVTVHQPSGEQLTIYDAAMRYASESIPLIVFGGEEYGTGSARDWAAKGTRLLGVSAVVASSFEQIHRRNLACMGVLPCELPAGVTSASLTLDGSECFDLIGLDDHTDPGKSLTLIVRRLNGRTDRIPVKLRIDTLAEVGYGRHGGIMPYMLSEITKVALGEQTA
ncbi:MAG: aconitase family protein, partial [Planctomycetaceae bacterium]